VEYLAKIKLVDVAEESKARVVQLTHELTPLVRKVYEILPLYVAMSGHPESAKRILTLVRQFSSRIEIVLCRS
jgi:hypothetical protein